jgi:transposase
MLYWITILGGALIMMGQHDRSEALFYYFRLEDQVPETHLLRLIDKHISFAFVREKLKASYSDTGRPSIDPELLLRILLIGYLYGITSERKLVEELRMHLAWRWFTGLGFDQEIPHHSTFSKNRHGRFQESKLFEQLFEQIVRQCVEVGLVKGEDLSVDGSFVEANAAKESRIPREQLAEAAQVHHTMRQYLVELEQQNPVEEPVHEQEQVSTTDPDSTDRNHWCGLAHVSALGRNYAGGDGRTSAHNPRLLAAQQPSCHEQVPAGNLEDQTLGAGQIGRCYFADGYFAEDKPNPISDVCGGSRMGPFSFGAYRPLTSPDLLDVRVASA